MIDTVYHKNNISVLIRLSIKIFYGGATNNGIKIGNIYKTIYWKAVN